MTSVANVEPPGPPAIWSSLSLSQAQTAFAATALTAVTTAVLAVAERASLKTRLDDASSAMMTGAKPVPSLVTVGGVLSTVSQPPRLFETLPAVSMAAMS